MWLLLVALALAALVTWLSNGDFKRLEDVPLKHMWLLLVAALVQIAIFVPGFSARTFGGLIPYLYLASFALVLLALLINLKVVGIPLALAGVSCNTLAIALNGGYMPTSGGVVEKLAARSEFAAAPGGPRDVLVAANNVLSRSPKLLLLGDVFWMRIGSLRTAFSIGDMLLAAGLFWLLVHYSRRPRGRHRTGIET